MKMIVFLLFALGQSGAQAGLARTTLNAYTQGGKSLQTGGKGCFRFFIAQKS